MGGCRASRGGLHLGHVYGCFHGLAPGPDDQYFFVISDCIDSPSKNLADDVRRIYVDVMSITDFPVSVVRESRIRKVLSQLEYEIERAASFTSMRDAHPRRRDLRSGHFGGTVADLIFPVHQAGFLLGLGCAVACFNDDNSDLVRFARRAGEALRQRRDLRVPVLPQLVPRYPGRLESWDGRRMAKINSNCLFVDAPKNTVTRFARRLVGAAVPTGESFARSFGSERERTYAGLIGLEPDQLLELRGRERLVVFAEALWIYIGEIQARRIEVLRHIRDVSFVDLIVDHEKRAEDRITWVLEQTGAWQ